MTTIDNTAYYNNCLQNSTLFIKWISRKTHILPIHILKLDIE